MLSMYNLKMKNECERRSTFNKISIQEKTKNYYLSMLAKEAIKQNNFSMDFLKETIEEDIFYIEEEKETTLIELQKKIKRYLEYLKQVVVLDKDITNTILVEGRPVRTHIDLLVFHPTFNIVEAVKLKLSKPKLSYRGRKFSTKPMNDIELFLLYETLSQIDLLPYFNKAYPLKDNSELIDIIKKSEQVGSLHHLTSKRDKGSNFSTIYNEKKGDNIIAANIFSDEIKLRIKELINKEESTKVTKNDNCDNCSYKAICLLEEDQSIKLEEIKEVRTKAEKTFKPTESQLRAINFRQGIARINAGAGSGKTTIVSLRVSELLKKGVKPEDILLITFTNKGALEMKEKISFWLKEASLDNVDLNSLNIMTFNSWGGEVLSKYYHLLGFTKEPKLAHTVDVYDIILDLLQKTKYKFKSLSCNNPLMNFYYSKGIVVKIAELFANIKAHYIQNFNSFVESDFVKRNYYSYSKTLNKFYIPKDLMEDLMFIYSLYNEFDLKMKENNLIEYQDQINKVIELMEKHSEEIKELQYEHIIIDEFQDSDYQQLNIAKFLSKGSKFKSLMVVGDDSQSIYGFRNTSQEIILNFHHFFDNVTDINIIENFRSTKQILDLANQVNNLNTNKIDKDLVSGNNVDGEKPILLKFSNNKDKMDYIIEEGILTDLKNGIKHEDIAFLARTQSELKEMHKKLTALNIPAKVDINIPLIENMHFHLLVDLANYISNNSIIGKNNEGLFKFLYMYQKGFKNLEINAMREFLRQSINLIELEVLGGGFSPIKEDGCLIGGAEDRENTRKYKLFFNMARLIDNDQIQELLKEIKKDKPKHFKDLSSYLRKIILYKDVQSIETEEKQYKAITLSTVHSSKGREWDKVYLDLSKFKKDKNIDIEEERRLIFVGITRAKKELIISSLGSNDYAVEIEELGTQTLCI